MLQLITNVSWSDHIETNREMQNTSLLCYHESTSLNCTLSLEEKLERLQHWLLKLFLILIFTPHHLLCFLILNVKAIQMFKTIRGDSPEYIRTTYVIYVWVRYSCKPRHCLRHLVSNCIPHLEIYWNTYFQVHLFVMYFLHIFTV